MAFSTGSVFRPSGVKMMPYSVSTPKIRFCTRLRRLLRRVEVGGQGID
jgi:hypothetical protein